MSSVVFHTFEWHSLTIIGATLLPLTMREYLTQNCLKKHNNDNDKDNDNSNNDKEKQQKTTKQKKEPIKTQSYSIVTAEQAEQIQKEKEKEKQSELTEKLDMNLSMPMLLTKSRQTTFQRKIQRGDAIVIVLVTVLTLILNLGLAIVIGVIVSSLIYTWDTSFELVVSKELIEITHFNLKDDNNNNSSNDNNNSNVIQTQTQQELRNIEITNLEKRGKMNKKEEGQNNDEFDSKKQHEKLENVNNSDVNCEIEINNDNNENINNNNEKKRQWMKVYHLEGPIFFGNAKLLG